MGAGTPARAGRRAREADRTDRGSAGRNLVFLVDVSGSMAPPDKLPLVKQRCAMLVDRSLRASDRVSIVIYAGASGLVLPPTSGRDRQRILDAIERLEPAARPTAAQGIELAYAAGREEFIPGGVNRVILAPTATSTSASRATATSCG